MTAQRKQHIAYLLAQYVQGIATAEQESLLFQLAAAEENSEEWQSIIEELMAAEPDDHSYHKADWENVLQKIIITATPIRSINWYKRIAVAASITLFIAAGSYFAFFKKSQKEIIASVENNDISPPDKTKATLTLADGRIVHIDSLSSGAISTENNVTVIKTADGKIVYTGKTNAVAYNTLYNPRGSKVIDMQLSDGSHVWLNAGSSVTYPVAFTGKERKISMTGEAYFEITTDKTKPFIVNANNKGDVEVLGTKFNVNVYDDEDAVRTTLLEGSVQFSEAKTKRTKLIKPGEQVILTGDGKLTSTASIDVEEVMAWKNGKFMFGEKSDMAGIMRQISRWYDVEIVYKGAFTKYFGGSVSREVNVSEVLIVLESTGDMKFTIEARKITVLQL